MTTRNGLPGAKKNLSLARRGGRCTTRNVSRVASRRPLPSSSSLVFRRHLSPFRSPARPPRAPIPRSRAFVAAAAVTAARPLLHTRSA
jgi:hypothetical protein